MSNWNAGRVILKTMGLGPVSNSAWSKVFAFKGDMKPQSEHKLRLRVYGRSVDP